MSDSDGAMRIEAALVRQLAELLDDNRLTEIEVEDGDRRIRVARKPQAIHMSGPAGGAAMPASTAMAVVSPATGEGGASAAVGDHPGLVRSPMVGTAYLAPEPDARSFVVAGDTVSEGQTLLIIEAMKVMNPISAPRAGKVIQVIVANGQPVEYDQPLVVIE